MGAQAAYTNVSTHDGGVPESSTSSLRGNSVATAWAVLVEDGWLLEVLSLLLGCMLLLALCVVLHSYDGQQVPTLAVTFGAAITLNTLTAIMATAIQACLLYPILECLGQLKWRWLLGTEKCLEDLHVFDSASRGPIGSMVLMWKYHVKYAQLYLITLPTD